MKWDLINQIKWAKNKQIQDSTQNFIWNIILSKLTSSIQQVPIRYKQYRSFSIVLQSILKNSQNCLTQYLMTFNHLIKSTYFNITQFFLKKYTNNDHNLRIIQYSKNGQFCIL
ncbi:hypothetical protein pb186bvf_019372 [Paramecium bursaria]